MARKSIDELEKLTTAAEAKKSKLAEEIDDLMRQKAEAHEAAQAAAEAGDVDLYMAKHQEAERLDAQIYVKRTQMDKSGGTLSSGDVLLAWDDFAKGFNKELAKEWDKFLAERNALAAHFMRIVLMQNDALKLRERCGRLAGEPDVSMFKMDYIDAHNAPGVAYGHRLCTMAEVVYFMSSGEASEADGEFFNAVLRNRKPF